MTPRSEPALGEETIPPNEGAFIDALLAIQGYVQQQLDRRAPPATRGQHPKQHGCVRGEWQIAPDLPAPFRHGLFAQPHTYPALVRFSNARQRHDDLPDAHGMAVKLLDVDGRQLLVDQPEARTQDFVLIDHPVFFAKDVADLVPLMIDFRRLMTGSVAARAAVLLKGAVSPDYRFRILRRMLRKRAENPALLPYWTTTPLKFGPTAARFMLRSVEPAPPSGRAGERPLIGKDKLRLALIEHLRQREARFDVLAQLQTDPATMPIENASQAWDEKLSPYHRVATLRLPVQEFDAEAQRQFGENLSFTPWHGLQDHRPLGGINRARKRIYDVMSRTRRELNGAPTREPTLDEVDAIWPPPRPPD